MVKPGTPDVVFRRARWALVKVARGQRHVDDLAASMNQWYGMAQPRTDAAIAEDRLSFEVRLRIDKPPPLDEWALIVGDAVHNMRSALDVLVWAMADTDKLTDKEVGRLAFPVVERAEDWPSAVGHRLPTVPAWAVDRMKGFQPFALPATDEKRNGLALVTWLDNRDKHRLALHANPVFTDMSFQGSIEFEDEEGATASVPPDQTIHGPDLVDGALLVEQRTKGRIATVGIEHSVGFDVQIETDRAPLSMLPCLGMLSGYCRALIFAVGGLNPRAVEDLPEHLRAGI